MTVSGRMVAEWSCCRPTTCREHVELAYASTAHRAQGRTVDTAHALVSPTTTREVLYVAATRGREANRLYVDTHYDPDPQTSHDHLTEAQPPERCWPACCVNEGADVAAHDMIRRTQNEAESFERLAAEYLTLAAAAQAERWDALLERSGLTQRELEAVRSSEAHGPLHAAFREAEAAGLDIEAAFPHLVAVRSLSDADDEAAVLHARVHRLTQAASGRRRGSDGLIAGLIPRARGVSDPDMAGALTEREQAMELRARTLAIEAIGAGHDWVQGLGPIPEDLGERTRWLREVSTVAAYRDCWHITGPGTLGARDNITSTEQIEQLQRTLVAGERARAIRHRVAKTHTGTTHCVEIETALGAGEEHVHNL